ncbi:MAG: phage holin family protein [Opitutaceae bacterium]|jgi:putative membrane protein|nr:phage holin family protein [Opitutaceae bacterium]
MNRSPFLALIVRWLVLALGVTLAEKLVTGISCADGVTLLVVVLLLSFFNAVLRPLLVLFSLPFIVLTMGLGLVVINALLFLLVGELVEGFEVAGFWPAFFGALIVGLTNFVMTLLMKRPPGAGPGGGVSGGGSGQGRLPKRERGGADVIDV